MCHNVLPTRALKYIRKYYDNERGATQLLNALAMATDVWDYKE